MNKAILMDNGREISLHPVLAKYLVDQKRASYMTRDMVAEELTLEQWHDKARQLGVKVHHRAGIQTVREAIAAARQ